MSTTLETVLPLYEEVVKGFDKLLSDPGIARQESAPLREARQSAFDRFRLLGFPSIRNEDWKYTNILRFLKEEYEMGGLAGVDAAKVAADASLVKQATVGGLDCYQVVLVNGIWDGEVKGGPLPEGIELFRVAVARQDPAFSAYFERRSEWDRYHFASLNAALYTDGLFLRVEAGAAPEKPLHIIHTYSSDRNLLVQPRHVWVVNRNAGLSVIETVVGGGEAASFKLQATSQTLVSEESQKIWSNTLTEIIAHADARLNHAMIQTAGEGIRIVQNSTIRQKKGSLYNNFTFTLPGAELVRNDLQVRLEEDHTETHLYGLYLAAGHQLVDNHTLVDHQKPHCFSNELYKGVLLEQSTGVFNGKVFVHPDAQKTNAFQQNNNLVISKKATIDSKPELEIYADDVKCSHGSTVGQFSEDALFYLRARGIGEDKAKALLINAFAFDVTEKIPWPAVEEYVNELISHHIPVANG
jgi:Fe-S cluster assembly protein SufD